MVVVVVNLTTEDHPDVLTGKADMLPAATKQKGQLKAGGKTKNRKTCVACRMKTDGSISRLKPRISKQGFSRITSIDLFLFL